MGPAPHPSPSVLKSARERAVSGHLSSRIYLFADLAHLFLSCFFALQRICYCTFWRYSFSPCPPDDRGALSFLLQSSQLPAALGSPQPPPVTETHSLPVRRHRSCLLAAAPCWRPAASGVSVTKTTRTHCTSQPPLVRRQVYPCRLSDSTPITPTEPRRSVPSALPGTAPASLGRGILSSHPPKKTGDPPSSLTLSLILPNL